MMHKIVLSVGTSAWLLTVPVFSGDIEIDRRRTGQNTYLDRAANGVQVVNISTPNANAVSHNTYIEFNVPTQGVILNNARATSNTQLAGHIYGNENIKNEGASLILNEVSGTNRSQLNGFLEVAGKSSDVIVSNPNGIAVNGGGFINTPKATLTTGKVSLANGKASYTVDKGAVEISGKGLDATGTSKLEIYTKALKLNAKLYANDLDVVTGVNTIDANGQVTSKDSDALSRPAFSIDSTALGGIYANAISLRGTQKGVGVNLPIEILAQDRLKINADGQIIIGKAEVSNYAQMKSQSAGITVNEGLHASSIALDAKKEVNIDGNTGAKQTLNISADALNNSAVLAAGVDKDFTALAEGSLTLTVEKTIDNQGILYGASSLSSKSESLHNAEDAQILTSNLLLTTTDVLDNKGSIRSDTARISTSILLSAGVVESANTLDIEAYDRLDVSNGTLFSQNAMTLLTNHFVANTGFVQSNDTLRLEASTTLELSNTTLYAAQDMMLTTDAFSAEQSVIGSAGSLALTTKQFTTSDATLNAQGIVLNANNFVSSHTLMQSTDTLDIHVNENVLSKNDAFLANADITIDAQEVSLEETTLYSAFENIWIDVVNMFADNSDIEAKKELKLNVQEETTLLNTVLIADTLTLESKTVVDTNSSLVAGTQATITTEHFKSADASFFGDDIAIVTDWFSNVASTLYSEAKSLLIDADTIDNSAGLLSSTQNLTLKSNVLKNSNADIEAGGILDVKSAVIDLDNSRLFAGEALTIDTGAQTIDSNTKLLSSGTMELDFAGNLINHGEITSNGTLTLDALGTFKNNNIINAGQTLTLRANTLNNQTGAKIRGGGDAVFTISGDMVNRGFLTSSANLFLSAQNITNHAGIAANNTLSVESVNLQNYNTVYSGGDMYLYVSNLLSNNENANIFSAKSLTVAKNENNNKTNTIENLSAKIESQGNMNLYANNIVNKSIINIDYSSIYTNLGTGETSTNPEDVQTLSLGYYTGMYEDAGLTIGIIWRAGTTNLFLNQAPNLYSDSIAQDIDSVIYLNRHEVRQVLDFMAVEQTITDLTSVVGQEAQINSGGTLGVEAINLSNTDATISSAGDMTLNVSGTLSNDPTSQTLTVENYYYELFVQQLHDAKIGDSTDGLTSSGFYTKREATKQIGGTSQILAGGTISGGANILQNGITSHVDTSTLPNRSDNPEDTSTQNTDSTTMGTGTVPTGTALDAIGLADSPTSYDPSQNITLPEDIYGIFVLSDDPTGPLIESNPEYTNYNNFISSDYLLERLGYNGMEQTRRLGDAMYETQLIRDAIMAMTGQRFISNAMSDAEQYTLLMENAVVFAKEQGLEIGKKPTAKQLANLTEDMVWMEEKTVNGVQVLVPVVYLAKEYIKPLNANIAASSIDLTVDGHLANGGSINAREDMTLRTGTLTNEKGNIKAGRTVNLTAIGDIKNLSGSIEGGSVSLKSTQGNIIHKTLSKDVDATHQFGSKTYTVVEETASIVSHTGAVVLDAKKNIDITAATVSAKTSMTLNAKEDVTVKTIAKKDNSDYTFSNGYANKESTAHQQSTLTAGETLAVTSGNNINLEAVKIDAKNTGLTAKNKVNVTAVVDSEFKKSHFESESTFSESSNTDMSLKESVKGTTIHSDNLIIEGNKGVALESVNAKLNESVKINSKEGDVNFIAKAYTNAAYHEEESSSFGGLQSEKTIDAHSNTKLADSSTKAENHIVVSGKNVNIAATDLAAKGTIKLDAQNNVNIISGAESSSEYHLKEEKGISFNYSDGKATYAEINTDETQRSDTTNKASSLSSSTLAINSGQDTNVIASNINADVMHVEAKRDFNVLNDLDTKNTANEHRKKELGVEFTLNEEEASVFAGYWEESSEQNSNKATVVSSNIQVGSLDVTAKNTNIIGSNVSGTDISIDSENINVLSATSNTNAQAYSKSIKAGVEVAVRQNISTAVDAVSQTGNAEGASATIANGLRAYDALQTFSEQPVTAGVTALYEESSNNTYGTNAEVVASTLFANNALVLNAANTLEIAGSDVGSANSLSMVAENINIHASQGTSTTASSSESKNASLGLYSTNFGQVSVGFQENEMQTEGLTQRNSQIYTGGTATVTSRGDTTFSGANVYASELRVNVEGDLSVESLQDTQNIAGSSKGGSISGNVLVGVPTGISANAGKTTGEKAWVSQASSLNGSQSVQINVGGTTTLTGASITNINAAGEDKGNLVLNTKALVLHDIQDIDTYESTSAGIGLNNGEGNTPALNQAEYSNSTTDREQITRATIGAGTVNAESTTGSLNRDITKMQEVTKDESSSIEVYVSDKSLALATNPTDEIASLGHKLADVGLTAHKEILENLPTEKGKTMTKMVDGKEVTVNVREDGTEKNGLENFIDDTVGVGLDSIGNAGILPSVGNSGGYVTQLAIEFFGDNRAWIVEHDKSKLDALTKTNGEKLRERQAGDGPTDWDYEKITMVKTEDGVRPISEGEDTTNLKIITTYRTNPDKQLVIEDGSDKRGNPELENYKIRISEQDIKDSGIDHIFTNGMFNSHDTAVYNQQTQQGFADGILNYNQMHGVAGDLLESLQDAISVNTGLSELGTGGARQTGDLIVQMAGKNIRNGDLTVGGHSQGTLMTQVGMTQNKERLGELVQDNTDAAFLVQYSGAPVNHNDAEALITDIYRGEKALENRQGVDEVSDVFRSNVTPEDAVGSVLGYQSAGINNSENLGVNMGASFLAIPRLFGLGDPSPHSYYPCVIGCGNENYTPSIKNIYAPNTQTNESSRVDYYRNTFTNKAGELTVDISLLPQSSNIYPTNNAAIDLKNIQGVK